MDEAIRLNDIIQWLGIIGGAGLIWFRVNQHNAGVAAAAAEQQRMKDQIVFLKDNQAGQISLAVAESMKAIEGKITEIGIKLDNHLQDHERISKKLDKVDSEVVDINERVIKLETLMSNLNGE